MHDTSFKNILFDDEARSQLVDGVNTLANAVKITMGPRGQNVAIERPNMPPHLTKDGVSVAKSINLREKFRNLGSQMIKEAASRTAEVAGDGTTTATVLAQSIFTEGLKMIAAGYSSTEIQKGIRYAVTCVIDELKTMSIPISNMEEIIQVGTISANGDESIGKMLADAMSHVGNDGVITVEEAKGFKTTLDIVEGLELDRGFLSPYFITDQDKMAAILDSPQVLLINKKITSLNEILPILEQVSRTQQSLLIIADDVDGDALHGLVINKLKGTLNVCAIRAPEFGEARVNALGDLGLLFGCEPLTALTNEKLDVIKLESLGKCKKIISYKHRTIFVGGTGDEEKIKSRLSDLKNLLNDPTLDQPDHAAIARRIQRLSGAIAVLRVGAATEIELRERKDRVEDALNATQAAIEEGIVAGGGMALVKAARCLKKKHPRNLSNDFVVGIEIVRNACFAPLRQIVINTGESAEIVVQKASKIRYNNYGYNAASAEWVDMFDEGIIDPLKVVRSALENASSTARMLLSVGCTIVEDDAESGDAETGLIFS